MKVVYLDWNSLGSLDCLEAYRALGHEIVVYDFPREHIDSRSDFLFEGAFAKYLKRHNPDYVFSFNYFPIVSKICHEIGDMPYVSWVYDSPCALMYSFTVIYPCNHIFVFDKGEALLFEKNNIKTVHYLPMATNAKRLKELTDKPVKGQIKNFLPKAPVSFVGDMYTEKMLMYDQMVLDEETKELLSKIMDLQMSIWGDNYIEESLTPDLIGKMEEGPGLKPSGEGVETSAYLYAQYVINRKISSIERSRIVSNIGQICGCNLYTRDVSVNIPNINLHGPVEHYEAAPIIYHNSQINLSLPIRSIRDGIPLKTFDIFGAGGFLFTGHEPALEEFFREDEDYVSFKDEKELYKKLDYYVSHENECRAIGASAQAKVLAGHSFEDRIK